MRTSPKLAITLTLFLLPFPLPLIYARPQENLTGT